MLSSFRYQHATQTQCCEIRVSTWEILFGDGVGEDSYYNTHSMSKKKVVTVTNFQLLCAFSKDIIAL